MDPELKEYLDAWFARRERLFDKLADAFASPETRLRPADHGNSTPTVDSTGGVFAPVQASSDTAKPVLASAGLAQPSAPDPTIGELPAVAVAVPIDTSAMVPAPCLTDCVAQATSTTSNFLFTDNRVTAPVTASSDTTQVGTASAGLAEPLATVPVIEESPAAAPAAPDCLAQAVPASTTTTLLSWVSSSSSPVSPPMSATEGVLSTELVPDNDTGEQGTLLEDISVDVIPALAAAATGDGNLYGKSINDSTSLVHAFCSADCVAQVVTMPWTAPATAAPSFLWTSTYSELSVSMPTLCSMRCISDTMMSSSSAILNIRCHGMLLRPMPWPSFLIGQLNAAANRPRPWPSFLSCGGMKPIDTPFAAGSSSILQLVVVSVDGEWCSYCWISYCVLGAYNYWGVECHELGAATSILQESLGCSYCYLHSGAVQKLGTLVCCSWASLWLRTSGYDCTGYFRISLSMGKCQGCTACLILQWLLHGTSNLLVNDFSEDDTLAARFNHELVLICMVEHHLSALLLNCHAHIIPFWVKSVYSVSPMKFLLQHCCSALSSDHLFESELCVRVSISQPVLTSQEVSPGLKTQSVCTGLNGRYGSVTTWS